MMLYVVSKALNGGTIPFCLHEIYTSLQPPAWYMGPPPSVGGKYCEVIQETKHVEMDSN